MAIVLGIHPTPKLLSLHPMELFDGRRIVASVFGDFKGKSQLPFLAEQCMAGVTSFLLIIYSPLFFSSSSDDFSIACIGGQIRRVYYSQTTI